MSVMLAPFFGKKRNKIGQQTVSLCGLFSITSISTIVDETFGFSGHFCPVFFAKIPYFYAILTRLKPHANKLCQPKKSLKLPQIAPKKIPTPRP